MVLNYVLVGCPWRFIVLTEQRDQVGLISVAMKTNNLMAILDHPLCTHNFFWKQNTLDKHLTTIEGVESETFLAVLTFTCTALVWWKTMNSLCNDVSSIARDKNVFSCKRSHLGKHFRLSPPLSSKKRIGYEPKGLGGKLDQEQHSYSFIQLANNYSIWLARCFETKFSWNHRLPVVRT